MSGASLLEESGVRVIEPSKLVVIKDHTPNFSIFCQDTCLRLDFLGGEYPGDGGK